MTALGETPMKGQFPVERHERMINAHLTADGIEIALADRSSWPTCG